jgi:AraC-like DNA-binding protein
VKLSILVLEGCMNSAVAGVADLMRRRIEHARTLLETTAQSIKTIAHSIGYEDESSFRKAFRKLAMMSPQAYWAQRAIRPA